jgi:hypothetical protein
MAAHARLPVDALRLQKLVGTHACTHGRTAWPTPSPQLLLLQPLLLGNLSSGRNKDRC